MSDSILIQGGLILDPSVSSAPHSVKPGAQGQLGDLLIKDGKIVAVDQAGKIPRASAGRVIDAKGAWILPGLIDVHVHLREPGLEYKETIETGTRAAVAGGFTSIACMANTSPVNDNPYITAFIRDRAKQAGHCRVFPIGAVSKGLKGEELAEIAGMVAEGAVALSDDGMPVMNSYLMRKAMDYSKAFGIPIISHAEDAYLVGQGVMNEGALSNQLGLRGNPTAAEEIMVAREIALCRLTGAPVHIAHISSEIALRLIRHAKEDGLPVTAEVSPHHLFLTEESLRGYDTAFKMAPPLRAQRDVEALRRGLAEGVIDLIATDHAPHAVEDKALGFDEAANGIIGLQTAVPLTLQLVHQGILTPLRWVESLSTAPARLLNLPHGSLQVGQEADVTILAPDTEWTLTRELIQSKSCNSPFLGQKLRGKILATIVAGKIKWED